MKKFNYLGIMIDCSRNAVMSVEGLKNYLPIISKMGYNCLFLYTEDTYEVDGEPYFGYMRGRYTKEELREIDEYAKTLGIEVIPCIQTLAHLHNLYRWWLQHYKLKEGWQKFALDTDDILLVGDERTYDLIDNMFASLSTSLSTKKIHIGMDEAHMLGRGVYLDKNGYETCDMVIKKHLDRVCEIAKKYGYEPLMWSDMFFRPWNNGGYYVTKTKIPDEYVKALPESVAPVYWNYYSSSQERYENMLDNHRQLSKNTWFAGGAWTWSGFAPSNNYTLTTMIPAINACKNTGTRNIFFTMWGDNGGECSRFAIIPALFYLAEYAKGNTDEDKIKAKFERRFGISYDDFALLDTPNAITEHQINIHGSPKNISKHMLYSDPLCGFLDYTVAEGGSKKYEEKAKALYAVAKKTRKYGYLFTTMAKLCDALAVKYELGVRTRAAYLANDKTELLRLANEDYVKAGKAVSAFATALEKQWNLENKTFGFEVQDYRLGGLMRRLESCRRRLIDYANGKIDRIEELECEILPIGDEGDGIYFNDFGMNVSCSPI